MSENNLKHWQEKIKEKRKTTDFRDFLMEIASWIPIVLHKNNGLTSRYPESDRAKVCSISSYENLKHDLHNKDYNIPIGSSFSDSFKLIFQDITFGNLLHFGMNHNADYADVCLNSNNVYLSFITINNCENIFYSFVSRSNTRNVFNGLYVVENSENIYFSSGIANSYKTFYSSYINNSSDIWFSTNLTGCSNCILCDDLQNCSYYIKNIAYSQEEYKKIKSELLKDKQKFIEYYKAKNKKGNNSGSVNVTGNCIFDSENIDKGSYVNNVKNARNILFCGSLEGCENFYDVFPGGSGGGNNYYGVTGAGMGSDNLYCSAQIATGVNIFYSYYLENCSYCIGCIGLINKSYCILNKQYTKDEWYKKADEIFSLMEVEGTLGDFFPGSMNPFYFNDTVAGLIGGFSKQEVTAKGYMWRDEKIKVDIPEGVEVILTDDLNNFQGHDANGNWKINPEILKVVIKDQKGNYYKIIQEEYDFLLKHGLPIPEIHWMERMKLNFEM